MVLNICMHVVQWQKIWNYLRMILIWMNLLQAVIRMQQGVALIRIRRKSSLWSRQGEHLQGYRAAGFFRRRQQASRAQLQGYALRAAGFQPASSLSLSLSLSLCLSELGQFYKRKFSREDTLSSREVMDLYLARAGPVPAATLFNVEEVEAAVYRTKRGKSADPDGVVYEHVQIMMSTDLKH